MQARLKAMETTKQQDPEAGDVSEVEEESLIEGEEPAEESVEVILLKSTLRYSSRLRIEIPTYNGSLEPK